MRVYRAPPRAALLTGDAPQRHAAARYPPERKASSLRGLRRQPDAPVIGKAAEMFSFPPCFGVWDRNRTCDTSIYMLCSNQVSYPLCERSNQSELSKPAPRAGLEPATSRVAEMPVHAIGTRRADSQAQRASGASRTPAADA